MTWESQSSIKAYGPSIVRRMGPFGDEKTKIAGGYGRFNDTGRLSVASFTLQRVHTATNCLLGEFFSLVASWKGAGLAIAKATPTSTTHEKQKTWRTTHSAHHGPTSLT